MLTLRVEHGTHSCVDTTQDMAPTVSSMAPNVSSGVVPKSIALEHGD